jgi:inosose dehydratase
LCWDVGHALYGGIDPLDVVRRHPERIAYLHLKDVDGEVLDGLRRDEASFETGIRRRVFTEVGRGRLDVPGLLSALREIGYAGWLMVEQDSSWLAPAASARASRAYLSSLGL